MPTIMYKEELFDMLKTSKVQSDHFALIKDNKTKSKEPYSSVMFIGDDDNNEFNSLISCCFKNGKKVVSREIRPQENFVKDLDLIIANFNPGKKHDEKALFFMGVGYQVGVPTLLLEGSAIPYPPLTGLARRVLVGENRFEQACEYLKNLGPQHIEDEALVYYALMKKFNN